MKKIKFMTVMFLSSVVIAVTLPAHAHNMWLNIDKHYPAVGDTVEIGIGWGHKYPANRVDQEIREGTLQAISVLDPDGKKIEPEKVSESLYKLKIAKKGVYVVVANTNPGVFTQTTEGRKWSDKKGLDNAIKCTTYEIMAKSIIVAGGDDSGLDRAGDQTVEIIPLDDPAAVKAGGKLRVKVLFKGKPLAGAGISGTYAGFTAEKVDDHGGHTHRHAFDTETDKNGEATIDISKNGYWMISMSHRPPYPDTETCDEYMYNSAFTIEVK